MNTLTCLLTYLQVVDFSLSQPLLLEEADRLSPQSTSVFSLILIRR